MTKLLQHALDQVQRLNDQQQDALAALILEELLIAPDIDGEGVALARERNLEIEAGQIKTLTREEFNRLSGE